jgi:hypothetical protein
MRLKPIDLDKLEVPEGWEADAAKARAAVEAADEASRAKVINANREVWRKLKAPLGKLTKDKCWYSEARQVGTDRDVDHYRPKNAVSGTDHPGYYWLAFDKTNYRYSCIFCNRRREDEETGEIGGKYDYFPLWNEERRALTPNDDLDLEQPLLLDPCKAGDPQLLAFADNGEAMPRYSEEKYPRLHERARKTIETYHLNHSDFVGARIELMRRLEGLVKRAERFWKRLDEGNTDNEAAYSNVIDDILDCIDPDAEFSAFAKMIVDRYRDKEYLAGVA